MQGYNLIVVFNENEEKVLMCKRRGNPYKGLSNFVGGKIEKNEDGIGAAYRELEEATAITKDAIKLTHLMDFIYYLDDCYVELYVDFFDELKYAGEGNIGHIMKHIEIAKGELLV